MSSLMQHRGQIRGNKVELLMYLVAQTEQQPPQCDNCGTHSTDVNEWQCSNCKRLFWARYYLNPNPDPKDPQSMKLFTRRHEALGDDCYPVSSSEMAAAYLPVTSKYDVEPVTLHWGEKDHVVPKLYRIWRKPVGMLGCWVVFKWNNEEHVPDLSVPISVEKLPKDVEPLTDEEAIEYWSH